MEVTSRHHLRDDEIDELRAMLDEKLGVELAADTVERVGFAQTDREILLVDGAPLVATFGRDQFVTVRGANALEPTKRVVTVDAGAVSFVSDGANVMRPGIVTVDEGIEPADLVVVTEENHGKAIAVGRATASGEEMIGDSGMVVETVHHVGDDLYEVSP